MAKGTWQMNHQPLFNIPFLAGRWEEEYLEFKRSGKDSELMDKLERWSARKVLAETKSEAAFIKMFFSEIWGYSLQGENLDGSYQCQPQFPVCRAGQLGGTGKADAGLGYFGTSSAISAIPQVMCEFKDINSALDQKQNRKGNDRSPVRQCLDYIRETKAGLTGNELVEPTWGIVTDMNEFRLYFRIKGDSQYQRFVLKKAPDADENEESLLADAESSAFLRFIFWKIFHRTSLLAERGTSFLEKVLRDQIVHEKALERDFYLEYKTYREFLYRVISESNPDFNGTKGRLVRLTQCLLDRCLFILFCEDMGKSLEFPCDLLRDVLISYSCDKFYNPNDSMPWERLKNIFTVMRDGGIFGQHQINRFNGGLFEINPELERLKIPAYVFCDRNQGAGGEESLLSNPRTLLYFSSKYNFGIKDAGHSRVIDFYALGRIFEQSITELEIMEAEAEGRPSINLLSKRKRDGVYYTPEWVTDYIVRETIGASLRSIKDKLGLRDEKRPDDKDIAEYQAFLKDRRRTARVAGEWLKALQEYKLRLNHFKVLDPACGSGAFLIQSLDFLRKEHRWIVDENQRLGEPELWDADSVINSILSHNIYGVDINPESVEIAKLALWMHTASPGKPLSSLDHNIRCGNSLVSTDFSDFYRRKRDTLFEKADEGFKERVNPFNWEERFPEVYHGKFDCVIGNPPYVKLQNFRRVHEDVADYLVNAKCADGKPLYESTQTGNFDLYLPFIEKGISLLKPDGRMGYIAPNVWVKNEYGAALRAKLKKNRNLDRWIDFKNYQIFDEAITYTALQFFKGSPVESIKCNFSPDGDISHSDWEIPHADIKYSELPETDAWNLMPDAERALIAKLKGQCASLIDSCKGITVGIQTSADSIYHLTRISQNKYRTKSGEDVEIEDDIMHPLVSGQEAKRYQTPKTDTYLLFPYEFSGKKVTLISEASLKCKFPNAWNYLGKNEKELRGRENGKMNDDSKWWAYNYPKNLDKQELPKLGVAETVPSLRVFADIEGKFYFNNVRVNGILPNTLEDGCFLLGILNAPVADFVFKRIAKDKEGGFYEANKQFIAPLPIPDATDQEKEQVANFAKRLQELHTRRRDLIAKFDDRLNGSQTVEDSRDDIWLWADIGTSESWINSKAKPDNLSARDLKTWAKNAIEEKRQFHYLEIEESLKAGSKITLDGDSDEICLKIDGIEVFNVFTGAETPLILAQWRHKTRDLRISDKFTPKRLISDLLSLRKCSNPELTKWIIDSDKEIEKLDIEISTNENDLNQLVYKLYALTSDEIRLVEGGGDHIKRQCH